MSRDSIDLSAFGDSSSNLMPPVNRSALGDNKVVECVIVVAADSRSA